MPRRRVAWAELEQMRIFLMGLVALAAACATPPEAPRAAIPEPATIAVNWNYWGNPTTGWSLSRTGEGRYSERGAVVQTFAVTPEAFARMREIFRPYEGLQFECERTVTDGPYGAVTWSSQEGQVDQRTGFDAGCVSGDADDLFARLDQAEALVRELRGAPAP